MPWRSKQQARWGNSPSGVKELGSAKVHEFNEATKNSSGGFKKLPKKIKKKNP